MLWATWAEVRVHFMGNVLAMPASVAAGLSQPSSPPLSPLTPRIRHTALAAVYNKFTQLHDRKSLMMIPSRQGPRSGEPKRLTRFTLRTEARDQQPMARIALIEECSPLRATYDNCRSWQVFPSTGTKPCID